MDSFSNDPSINFFKRAWIISINDNKISLVLHCIVSYGVNLLAMSDNLEESVRYRLEQFTGMTVEHIDILIDGIRVID